MALNLIDEVVSYFTGKTKLDGKVTWFIPTPKGLSSDHITIRPVDYGITGKLDLNNNRLDITVKEDELILSSMGHQEFRFCLKTELDKITDHFLSYKNIFHLL
ncbi:hypothetical protein CF8_0038 [Aeromonas phage CF8]|nr:hypothetical protein CF8_0038 [Aeromonas phage CF8]